MTEGTASYTVVAALTLLVLGCGSIRVKAQAAGGGKAYGWGGNPSASNTGAVGDGTSTQRLVPTAVAGAQTYTQVVAGNMHSCGLLATGMAHCWGLNSAGQLGDGTTQGPKRKPVAVSTSLTFKSLVAGYMHTCGIASTGLAYCWGDSAYNQMGEGRPSGPKTKPTAVPTTARFTSLAAGPAHTCGVTEAGKIMCWGSDAALGQGMNAKPAEVRSKLVFSSVTAGPSFVCALEKATGKAFCWGSNSSGRLGDGTTTTRSVPTAVKTSQVFIQLAAGNSHVCGLTKAGTAYCWGSNSSGQLGDSSATDRLTPVAVKTNLTFKQLAAGSSHSCGVDAKGAANCWGNNGGGQLGDGTKSSRRTPTAVSGELAFSLLACGSAHTLGIAA